MALIPNEQISLSLNRLYEISIKKELFNNGVFSQLRPNIFIKDGTVNVYHSNSATVPTQTSEMTLASNDTNITGEQTFTRSIPKYIAIIQNTGTTTEIVGSGLNLISDISSIS